MAKLDSEITIMLRHLIEQLLDIVDEAKRVEFLLLQNFGETNQTVIALDELTEIAQQSANLHSQLSKLRLRVAESQPIVSPDMLRLLTERMAIVQNRVPALERSTEEIKLDWGL